MSLELESAPPGASFLTKTPERIFTVEDFSPDEKLMIDTAEQFSRKEVLPVVERLEKQEEGLMPSLIRNAGQLGFIGVDAAEKYGGLGQGRALAARILEFLSLNGSFSVTVGVTSGIGQSGISLFGNEQQCEAYLPRIIAGEALAAYCLSEPDSGSDALSASTRADLVGDEWVLNGTKMWVSNAKWAENFLVLAQIGGERFSAFLVERGFPGVSIAREEHKLGLKGSSTARVLLENARVPKENLLYKEGLGHHVALNSLNLGRFKLSSMCLGQARDALALAAQYVQERKQFGHAIGEFGLIQKKIAEMAAMFFVAESMVYRTGAMIDDAFRRFGGTVDGNRKAAEEYAIECSACKVFASEAQAFIVDEALQCFGGYGFTEEFPIARHYRDARVSRIYEGTNEINRVSIASRIFKKANQGAISLMHSGDSFVSELAARVLASIGSSPAVLDQIQLGALADLAILTYAEQSARVRSKATGRAAQELFRVAAPLLHIAAAKAFRSVSEEPVPLPVTATPDYGGVAKQVYEQLGPL